MKSNTIEFLKDTFHFTNDQAAQLLAKIRRNMEVDDGRDIVRNHRDDFITDEDFNKAINDKEFLVRVAQTYEENITSDTGELEMIY